MKKSTLNLKVMLLACAMTAVVACGKNKDNSAPVADARGAQPPASPADPTPATPPTDGSTPAPKVEETKVEEQQETPPAAPEDEKLDPKDPKSAEVPPPAQAPATPAAPTLAPPLPPGSQPAAPKTQQTTQPAQPAAPKTQTTPVVTTSTQNISCKTDGLSKDEVSEMNRLISYAKNFTATGDDYVHNFLRDKANSQCNLQNLRAAHAIQAAFLEFTYPDSDYALTLMLNTKGVVKVVKVFGDSLNEDRTSEFVIPVGANNTTGIAMSGTINCLDVEPNRKGLIGCETAKINLKMGTGRNQAEVDMIVRRSFFNIDATFAQQDHRSQAEVEFRDYLGQRSVLKEDYVRKSLMQTFEVINGRSGFKGKLVSNRNEILVLFGPLTHNNSNISEVQFGQAAMISEDYRFENQNVAVSYYARNLILGAELLENDGRGTFTVRIELPRKSQGPDYADLLIHLDTKGVGLPQ